MAEIEIPTPAQIDAFLLKVYPAAATSFRCESIAPGQATARLLRDDSRLRPGGFVSGPRQFAAADIALWFLSFTVLGLAPMAVTTNINIDFLRPAKGGDLLARAYMLRAGKNRISGRVDLWMEGAEDKLVSHATGNYALLKSPN